MLPIRDRIREFRRVRAKELVWNPKNWRTHPKAQQAALHALLSEIGYADALLVRQLPDRRLLLIDGHLRAATIVTKRSYTAGSKTGRISSSKIGRRIPCSKLTGRW